MNVSLTKRQKIVISAVVLALGLLLIQSINFFILRYRLVLGLSILTLFLSFWALWEGLTRVKAVILLILPTLFTLGVSSFYFLLPIRWLTRIPVAILFCVSFYFLLLSQNIFSVAADRTIPLYRAASTVNFLFTLITAFFLNIVIFALDQSFYINGVVVALVSFPLILQTLWSVQMEKVSSIIIVYSAILSLIVGEGALALSFWPVAPTIWALLLAALLYVLLGVTTEFFRDRLNRRVVFEYLGVGVVVLIFATVVTSWVG
jgi:hypothetical protein